MMPPLQSGVFMSTFKFLFKRLIACIYEALVLIAIWMLVTWLFVLFFGGVASGASRLSLQLLLWFSAGVYFVLSWGKSGQTLALKAWKMKIVSKDNATLSFKSASVRYLLASILIIPFGLTILWSFFDKDRLFLHDRLLNTKCVYV
jgi:uncharacterized RDD family membrane protein YckC